jgi:hypothetical protein
MTDVCAADLALLADLTEAMSRCPDDCRSRGAVWASTALHRRLRQVATVRRPSWWRRWWHCDEDTYEIAGRVVLMEVRLIRAEDLDWADVDVLMAGCDQLEHHTGPVHAAPQHLDGAAVEVYRTLRADGWKRYDATVAADAITAVADGR